MMKTNIIVFMTDDHAQWASEPYGNDQVKTPNLTRLAKSGVTMRNAFTNTPVCSPARATYLTGRIPSQHGVHDYVSDASPYSDRDWLADELLLPQLLKRYGYGTGLFGKWNCSQSRTARSCFDAWVTRVQPERTTDSRIADRTGAMTDLAVAFMKERASQGEPFYIQIEYLATHSPWEGQPERLVSMYRDCEFREIDAAEKYPHGKLIDWDGYRAGLADPRSVWAQYYAGVTLIDENVGRILDALDTLGKTQETLVVYTSDHGLNLGHHGVWGKGNATFPANMLEESIRIPLIVSHPGALPSDTCLDIFVDHTDLFQTVLDHVGIEPSAEERYERKYPGKSFRPSMMSEPPSAWKEIQFGEYANVRMARSRHHKLIRRYGHGPDELFDLNSDPGETTNVIGRAENAPVVEQLDKAIEEFFAEHQEAQKSGLLHKNLPRHSELEAWRAGDPDYPYALR